MESILSRILLISGGAALGANARYWLGLWALSAFGPRFPIGTLLANITGSVLLGFLLALTSSRLGLPDGWRLLLAVGFCGSYTTFSSYAVESVILLETPMPSLGWINIVANNGLALGGALLGIWLGRTFL